MEEKFLKELHDLLEKYSVEISIGLSGDTHGVDSWIEISRRIDRRYEEIFRIDSLSAYDLKQFS